MDKIMSFKGRTRRIILRMIDVLTYVIISFIYYGVDYFFLDNKLGHAGAYAINALILLAVISLFRVIFKTYTNVWRFTSTEAYFSLVLSDLTGGFVAWGNTVADLFFWSERDCVNFGRRSVEIYVLD